MPVVLLSDAEVSVSPFALGAECLDGESGLISHVGLIAIATTIRNRSRTRLIHMMPPFRRDDQDESGPLYCIGEINLDEDESRLIETFLDEIETEYRERNVLRYGQYTIHPAATEATPTRPYPRFSCVGLVLEAYRRAEIELIDTEESTLPLIDLDLLNQIYPMQREQLQRSNIRKKFGIPGDGPWPILLAGYLVNAFARDEAEIRTTPYVPREGDAYFPPRSSNPDRE